MNAQPGSRHLSMADMQEILAVTRKLAAPFDLMSMMREVVGVAKQVLHAEWGSVWLYDAAADELELRIATDIEPVRVPASSGIVGACATTREAINVPDCYADPRFNRNLDRASGQRTRCMLALPLIGHDDALVGVMQVLNKIGGSFDVTDEALAAALAAQCAVALQRVRMTEALIEGEKMRQELEMARVVQMSTLPSTMPVVQGYDVYGSFRPASLTGGDTFDLSLQEQGLLTVLGDATGHGIAPALSVTQMHAMLRMAFRMGADLEAAVLHVNNELAQRLADDRFITAFIGLLDPQAHRMHFHSAGQAPILHWHAASGVCEHHDPTSFPLAAMPLKRLRPATCLAFEPGDILALISDGVYEYHDAEGEQFGVARVEALLAQHRALPAADIAAAILGAVAAFARGAPQEDDITIVLVKREGATAFEERRFRRDFAALKAIFAFSAEYFAREDIDREMLHDVDFALEELFTNMVKYSPAGDAEIRIALGRAGGGVEVTLTDRGVERFDVTRAPDADTNLTIEQRRPGGLGLHLIRRLVDFLHYEYSDAERESRIVFRKLSHRPGPVERKTNQDIDNAGD